MAKISFFVACQSLSVDSATGRLSMFNVYEGIGAAVFPVALTELALVGLWEREQGDETRDFQASVHLTGCGLDKTIDSVNFNMDNTRHRNIFMLNNLKLDEPGTLTFELLLNGEVNADYRIEVLQGNPPDAEIEIN